MGREVGEVSNPVEAARRRRLSAVIGYFAAHICHITAPRPSEESRVNADDSSNFGSHKDRENGCEWMDPKVAPHDAWAKNIVLKDSSQHQKETKIRGMRRALYMIAHARAKKAMVSST